MCATGNKNRSNSVIFDILQMRLGRFERRLRKHLLAAS